MENGWVTNGSSCTLYLHGAIWFNPYGWLSERPGIEEVRYGLSVLLSFRFKMRALAINAMELEAPTFAELARRTRTLNDDGDASKLSIMSLGRFSSFSNSTWMPESPLLHLSRRWCFVFRRSLLVRQINGPNRYLIMSALSNAEFVAFTMGCALCPLIDAAAAADDELAVTWFEPFIDAMDVPPIELIDDFPFRFENVLRNFCSTLVDVWLLLLLLLALLLPLLFLLVDWCVSTAFATISSRRGFFGNLTGSNGLSHNDGLETALICWDCNEMKKINTRFSIKYLFYTEKLTFLQLLIKACLNSMFNDSSLFFFVILSVFIVIFSMSLKLVFQYDHSIEY